MCGTQETERDAAIETCFSPAFGTTAKKVDTAASLPFILRRISAVSVMLGLACFFTSCINGSVCMGQTRPGPANVSQSLVSIRKQLTQAGTFYKQEKFSESAVSVAEAKRLLDELPKTAQVQTVAKPLRKSIRKATRLLKEKGVRLPAETGSPSTDERDQAVSEAVPANQASEDGVKFSAELAGILAERCSGCHGGERPRRRLRIESYASLMQGGASGSVIKLGDSEASLLLGKLKGTADGDRMPLNDDPLTDEEIAKFAEWIDAGAKLDVPSPNMELSRLAASANRSRLSPEELDAAARVVAEDRWRLAFPGNEPQFYKTDHFLIVAQESVAEDELLLFGKQLETTLSKSMKSLGIEDRLKGRMTVYRLAKAYDYAEFVRMNEKRELMTGNEAIHWNADVEGAIVRSEPRDDKTAEKDRLVQPVSSLLLHRLGAPYWYADGIGRVLRAKADSRSTVVQGWQANANRVFGSIKKSDNLLDRKLPVAAEGIATWAFGSFLHQRTRPSKMLLTELAEGTAFNIAFQKAYGTTPKRACDAWLGIRAKK